MKDVEGMARYCLLCGKQWGPEMKQCCTPGSLVVVCTRGFFKKRMRHYDLQGRKIDDNQLSNLRERERRIQKDLQQHQKPVSKPLFREGLLDSLAPGMLEDMQTHATARALEQLGRLMQYKPPRHQLWTSPYWGLRLTGAIMGCALISVGCLLLVGSESSRQRLAIIAVLVALGMVVAALSIRWLIKVAKSPLTRVPAVVLKKRHGFTATTNIRFLTVKTDDGRLREHAVHSQVWRQIREGDGGVAYFKGNLLLDFKTANKSG